MKKFIFVILVLPIFISNAFAQMDLPEGKWWKHPEVVDKIKLSDEQIEKIEKISNESMKKIIAQEAQFKIARLDLESLIDHIDQEKMDIEALEKQIDLVNNYRNNLEKERILMLARIRNILSKEAIQKLKGLRGKIRKRFREHRKEFLEDESKMEPMHKTLNGPGHSE